MIIEFDLQIKNNFGTYFFLLLSPSVIYRDEVCQAKNKILSQRFLFKDNYIFFWDWIIYVIFPFTIFWVWLTRNLINCKNAMCIAKWFVHYMHNDSTIKEKTIQKRSYRIKWWITDSHLEYIKCFKVFTSNLYVIQSFVKITF